MERARRTATNPAEPFRELEKWFAGLRTSMEEVGRKLAAAFARFPRWQLVVDDPSDWRPTDLRGVFAQMRAIVLHEFWVAADEPERSPGARWVLKRGR